jgi:hypothetical protein
MIPPTPSLIEQLAKLGHELGISGGIQFAVREAHNAGTIDQ